MVLNVVDEIINGSPKYNITPNGDGTSNIELANEVVEQGTALNRVLFNKIESVMSYNETTGEFDESTKTLNYTTNVNISNPQSNQRLLVELTNSPQFQNEILEIIKPSTAYSHSGSTNSVLLDNNNIFCVHGGYFTIINQSGTIVVDDTLYASNVYNPQLVKLENGNVFIVWYDGNNNSYGIIISPNGSVAKSEFSIGSFGYPRIINLSNGNVAVCGFYYRGSDYINTGYLYIYNQQGTNLIAKSLADSGLGYNYPQMISLSNSIVIVANGTPNNYARFRIYGYDGAEIKSTTSIGGSISTTGNCLIGLNNGKFIVIIGNHAYLYDSSGTLETTQTLTNSGCSSIIKLNDGKIFAVQNASYRLFGSDGVLVSEGNLSRSYSNSKVVQVNDVIVHIGDYSSANYITIFDNNANIIRNTENYSLSGSQVSIIKINNTDFITSGSSYKIARINKTILKINNIELDTILETGKFYELVYRSNKNKFIAEEVRNAN